MRWGEVRVVIHLYKYPYSSTTIRHSLWSMTTLSLYALSWPSESTLPPPSFSQLARITNLPVSQTFPCSLCQTLRVTGLQSVTRKRSRAWKHKHKFAKPQIDNVNCQHIILKLKYVYSVFVHTQDQVVDKENMTEKGIIGWSGQSFPASN